MELPGLVLPSVLSKTEPAVLDSGNGNESQRKLHNTLALTCLRFSIFAFHTQCFWVLIKTRLECILVVQKYLLGILDTLFSLIWTLTHGHMYIHKSNERLYGWQTAHICRYIYDVWLSLLQKGQTEEVWNTHINYSQLFFVAVFQLFLLSFQIDDLVF